MGSFATGRSDRIDRIIGLKWATITSPNRELRELVVRGKNLSGESISRDRRNRTLRTTLSLRRLLPEDVAPTLERWRSIKLTRAECETPVAFVTNPGEISAVNVCRVAFCASGGNPDLRTSMC